jgi:cytochrome P450
MTPGFGAMWAVTRYEDAKAMLADPRFELNASSYVRPDVPEHCLKYMRTMQEMDGPEHTRLRRLVSPAFTARRAAEFRPRITPIVDALLDDLAEQMDGNAVDLLAHFARPLPIDVICELVGIHAEDQDRLSGDELVTLVWHLVLAGQTPANLTANAVEALLGHPGQLAALRADESLMPGAVEELTRWCGPQLLSLPRYAREDTGIAGIPIGKGEPVTAALACANRDPRVFTNPDQLDLRRPAGRPAHLGYAHGPHFCLGAALARVQTETALTALLRRFPGLALADGGADRVPDPGTWRLTALFVTI